MERIRDPILRRRSITTTPKTLDTIQPRKKAISYRQRDVITSRSVNDFQNLGQSELSRLPRWFARRMTRKMAASRPGYLRAAEIFDNQSGVPSMRCKCG